MKKFKWLLPVLMLALVVTSVAGLFNTVAASPASVPQMAAVSNSTNSQASQPKEVKLDGNKSVDGVACSQIYALGINKQANNRASKIMNECGLGGPEPAAAAQSNAAAAQNPRPSVYGGTDVNTITGAETYPKVTQSETFVWGNANTVVVNMNDSSASPGCYSGVSYSTNGGSTFTRIQPGPFCTGHGTNYGDPTVVWDAALNMWFASDLATGCGGQGIGLWTSTNGSTWVAGSCAHSGTSDDRQSMWVDNNPSSAYYGRMYISWNDFAAGQGLFVTHSDNGTTWTSATVFSTFRRDVEITGSHGADGTVILAAMDEGSGGLGNRTNYIYKSTNGGTTWTSTTTGPAFPGPGDGVCSSNSYFAKINPIWRHMGWGQPAVGPANTVHYVYAQHGAGADGGDIYYVRSTDNGATWSAPVKLNTDGTTKAQWMPSLSASAAGAVMAAWFDRRDDSANNNSYKYYGRLSLDGGATWQADAAVSDVLSPQPLQPDSGIQSCYVGDYNYHSFVGNTALLTWVDGRNLISGNSQQDVYFDKVDGTVGTPTPTVTGTPPTATLTSTPTITPTPTATPCVGTYIRSTSTGAAIVPGTVDSGNHADDGVTAVTIPFSFKFYGQNFTSINVSSNGNAQFNSTDVSFGNAALPYAGFDYAIIPHWDDLRTDNFTQTGEGIFTSVTGSSPNRIFNIEWRAEYYSGGLPLNFEARLYETTGQIDLIYGVLNGTGASATVGIQKGTAGPFDQFEFDTGGLSQGFEITYLYNDPCSGTATPTNTPVPPTATHTATPPPPTNTATGVPATSTPPAPTVTATNCPNPFVDINGNVFYNAIMYLYCRGIVNGVDATHYGPAGTASRAQFAKVVVLGFAIPSYTPATPTFTDVPITYFAYQYIEAGFHAGILSGYDAATCAAIGAAFPCYGPNRPITRAQLTKLVVVAGNCPLFTPTSGQTFTDVGPSNIFFAYIESAHNAGVINGYPDNTFRPNNNIRRDEMAQIVYKAILNCPGQGSITPTAVAPTNTVVAPTSTPGMANVSITNFAFTPQTITVTVGTTVMWQNNGSAHTVTSDTLGQFDSGNIPAGGSYSHQFTTAGSYAYHCEYHSGMTGTVIVTP